MKAKEMHYFSHLFDKELYMFRTCPLFIIRSISTLYTRSRYLPCQFCWLSASRRQQNQHDKYLMRVYSIQTLLILESGVVQNMQSTLLNKFEKQCISLAFIIRIYHDARSYKCQNRNTNFPKLFHVKPLFLFAASFYCCIFQL